MIEALFRAPWRFGFFQAVRQLERAARMARKSGQDKPDGPVGSVADPRTEAVRLRASTSLAFPASEIVAARPSDGSKPPELTVGFMSLAGAMGALPPPYAALLQGRAAHSAFADFLDIFHSRLVGCFYAAWAKYRLPIAYERQEGNGTDDVSRLLRAMVGLGLPGLEDRLAIPDELVIHYGGEFARVARSAGGLERLLAWEFSLPITIEQFVGSWIEIAPEEQTRLSGDPLAASPFARLPRRELVDGQVRHVGGGAVLGSRIRDVEGAFRVVVGPLNRDEFRRLLPSGRDLRRMRDFVRLFAPAHLGFTIRLLLSPEAVPEPRLVAGDDANQLNWTSWLRSEPSRGTGAKLELAV